MQHEADKMAQIPKEIECGGGDNFSVINNIIYDKHI